MSNANVLVVEDDDPVRRLVIEYLRNHAYVNIRGARDGVEALHEISQNSYSVVVLDLVMPKMSGMDVLDSLTAQTADPSVKSMAKPPAVIVITSKPQDEVSNDAIENRSELVRDVFRKPLDLAALAASVDHFLWSQAS